MAPLFVSCVSAPVATSALQMSALPARLEKKTTLVPSGEKRGWKSPPGPVVSARSEPSWSERSQMFISPERSELNAIVRPSGDHAPRLSSRVEDTSRSGGPMGRLESGASGRRQRSAFWRRIAKASRVPSAERAASTSWPAPVVICSSRPSGCPSAVTGTRQMLRPPPRGDEKYT